MEYENAVGVSRWTSSGRNHAIHIRNHRLIGLWLFSLVFNVTANCQASHKDNVDFIGGITAFSFIVLAIVGFFLFVILGIKWLFIDLSKNSKTPPSDDLKSFDDN